jgi:hypothetical protein
MNWEPVLTDLYSEFTVVAAASAAQEADCFSCLSAVPVVDVVCLDAVRL